MTELQKLAAITLAWYKKRYDLFTNTNPMNVKIERGDIDENGNLVDITVENRAKEKASFEAWKASVFKQGSFYVAGEKDKFYPVVFNAEVKPYQLMVYRNNVHQDSEWNGNICLKIHGKTSHSGHLANYLKIDTYKFGNKTRCADVKENYTNGDIILLLEGGATYYFEGRDIKFVNVLSKDYLWASGGAKTEIKVATKTVIGEV